METIHHETAGGVVVDDAGRILVIVRDVPRNGAVVHEVRLPKGHIDPGETPEAAALREVGEESGYWAVSISGDLGSAHSEFDHGGRHHTRNERYFLMGLTSPVRGEPRVHPGSEEALFEPQWLSPEEAETAMTYPSEREFVRRARERL
jgi:8-oxo-dGTP pyrophosphatase MutT (NUDIX family)